MRVIAVPARARIPERSLINGSYQRRANCGYRRRPTRLTEEEGDAIDAAMQKRALKFRGAWGAIVSGGDLRSDQDVWPVLRAEIEKLYGVDRSAKLLLASN